MGVKAQGGAVLGHRADGGLIEGLRALHLDAQRDADLRAGLAEVGEDLLLDLLGGVGDPGRVELDLAEGTRTQGSFTEGESAIAHDGTDFIRLRDQGFVEGIAGYTDFAAINHNSHAWTVQLPFISPTLRLGATADEIYISNHATEDYVYVTDRHTGSWLRSVTLEDYDAWVWGISVVGDKLHLIDDGRNDYGDAGTRIAQFDATTGELLADVFLSGSPSGLWCREKEDG